MLEAEDDADEATASTRREVMSTFHPLQALR